MPSRRKLENAAFVLPVFGAALIVPPLINVFNVPMMVGGVPVEVIYLFAVWTLMIGATAWLSRHMGHGTSNDGEAQPPPEASRGDDG